MLLGMLPRGKNLPRRKLEFGREGCPIDFEMRKVRLALRGFPAGFPLFSSPSCRIIARIGRSASKNSGPA